MSCPNVALVALDAPNVALGHREEVFRAGETLAVEANIAVKRDKTVSHSGSRRPGLLEEFPAGGGKGGLACLDSPSRWFPQVCSVVGIAPAQQEDVG